LSVLIVNYLQDKIKRDETGGAYGKYGRQERFWWENLEEADHLENLGIDGNGMARTRLVFLRTRTRNFLLLTR